MCYLPDIQFHLDMVYLFLFAKSGNSIPSRTKTEQHPVQLHARGLDLLLPWLYSFQSLCSSSLTFHPHRNYPHASPLLKLCFSGDVKLKYKVKYEVVRL